MSQYYSGKRGKRSLFDPNSKDPFTLSRTKVDLFMNCSRCFFIDRRLGVGQPPGYPLTLNLAVDGLLKKEFDILREKGHSHDLMKDYKINLIPYKHPDLPIWRDDIYKYVGASILHKPTNLKIQGIVDDIWEDKNGVLYIVDYKATSTKEEISLEDKYKQGYKKQVEIYQWIYRQLGFEVSKKAYFVFANATKEPERFDN